MKMFFYPNDLKYFDNIETIQNEIQRGETIYDKFYENIMRKESVMKLQNDVEQSLNIFKENMDVLKEEMSKDNQFLVKANNQMLDSLKMLKEKQMKRIIKEENDIEKRREMNSNFEKYIKSTIDDYKQISEKEEIQLKKQEQRHKKVKEIISFEEMKRMEELISMEFQNIIFDSSKEKNGMNGIGIRKSRFVEQAH